MLRIVVIFALTPYAHSGLGKFVEADFDGDGKKDRVVLTGNSDTATIEIRGSRRHQTIVFAPSPGENDAGCKGRLSVRAEPPEVYFEDDNPSEHTIEEKELEKAIEALAKKGMQGFNVQSGDCVGFHFYYNPVLGEYEFWRP
jgi:hypothetical protein